MPKTKKKHRSSSFGQNVSKSEGTPLQREIRDFDYDRVNYARDMENEKDEEAEQLERDERLAATLRQQLSYNQEIDLSNVEIEVSGNRMRLMGFVDSDKSRRRLEEFASSLEGIESVDNQLDIAPRAAGGL